MKLHRWRIKKASGQNHISLHAKVWNPLNPKNKFEREFLVDTGASGCAVSQELAEKLGLESIALLDVVLADGSVQKAHAAYIMLEINGKKVYAFTIFGEGFTEILGLDVMRALGFHIDVPEKRVLLPYRKFQVKNIRLMNNMKPIYYKVTVSVGGEGVD